MIYFHKIIFKKTLFGNIYQQLYPVGGPVKKMDKLGVLESYNN